jgi:hypothetical protein
VLAFEVQKRCKFNDYRVLFLEVTIEGEALQMEDKVPWVLSYQEIPTTIWTILVGST